MLIKVGLRREDYWQGFAMNTKSPTCRVWFGDSGQLLELNPSYHSRGFMVGGCGSDVHPQSCSLRLYAFANDSSAR